MVNYSVNLVEMGERIRSLRMRQNKTQKYFADMLYISPSYLTLLEQGKRTATLDVLVQIAKVCDVSTDYLLFGNSFEQTDVNFKTYQRLSETATPNDLKNALRLAECYLSLDNTPDDFVES